MAITCAYEEWGPSAGSLEAADPPPLVLLHAFPLSRAMWRPVAHLLDDVRCVLVDLPGSGESPLPDGAPAAAGGATASDGGAVHGGGTAAGEAADGPEAMGAVGEAHAVGEMGAVGEAHAVGEMGAVGPDLGLSAEGVLAVMDELNLPRAVVAGVSMGGYVLLRLLRDHPRRIAGAALIDTKVQADTEEARLNRLRMADAALGDTGSRAVAPMATTLLGRTTRAVRPRVVSDLGDMLASARPEGIAWSQRAMAARPDTSEVLGAAAVPVTVVVGEEDEITPEPIARAMADLAPDAVLRVVSGAGHLSPLEAPGDVAHALRELLDRVADHR